MRKVWGIKSRNEGQEEALEHLLNPEIDLVILEGLAGSGKTLLAVAAGLHQVLDIRLYHEIIFTRAPVGIGEDIGFLPGTEEEKMAPWMGALMDNLEALQNKTLGGKFGKDTAEMILKDKIKIKAMQFMRGRSFAGKYIIIDECQNLTPLQVKILVSRAGEGAKVIMMGDIDQIDNRRLSKENNGLTTLINNAASAEFIKHVNLPAGERSRLATWAAETL